MTRGHDADLVAQLAAGRAITELAHPRQRTTGVIAVEWRGQRAIRICAHDCGLTALPPGLAALTALVRLDVGGNQLAALPGLPPALRELYVDANQLAALPPLPALAVLDANRNRLAVLPPLVGLAFAYVADNQLTALPAIRDVRYLNVSDNPLRRLSLADAGLRELRAERAQLEAMTLDLPGLRELSLRGNPLATLSETIGRSRQLRALDLRGNALDTLPDALRGLPLGKLDLRWNPLRAPPAWLDELRDRDCLIYA